MGKVGRDDEDEWERVAQEVAEKSTQTPNLAGVSEILLRRNT